MTRTRTVTVMAAMLAAVLIAPTPLASSQAAQTDEARLITDSIVVLEELSAASDKGIPKHLLQRAEAIVVIPSLIKGGFVLGGKHGKGILSVRNPSTGQWSAPAILKMTGGSIGWQIGLEKVDLVMLVMNPKGVEDLLADRFTIGGSASVTAGPVGRSADAATNAQLSSKILAYSRSQGLFAGASLDGAGLHADDDDIVDLYGESVTLRDVTSGKVTPLPKIVDTWRAAIDRLTK